MEENWDSEEEVEMGGKGVVTRGLLVCISFSFFSFLCCMKFPWCGLFLGLLPSSRLSGRDGRQEQDKIVRRHRSMIKPKKEKEIQR